MTGAAQKTKQERLKLIFKEIADSQPADSGDGARELLANAMKRVEDECSGVEDNPDAELDDGRMYPPADRFERHPPKSGVRLFRVKAQRVYFGKNGAILIEDLTGKALLEKAGSDGKNVIDLLKE